MREILHTIFDIDLHTWNLQNVSRLCLGCLARNMITIVGIIGYYHGSLFKTLVGTVSEVKDFPRGLQQCSDEDVVMS